MTKKMRSSDPNLRSTIVMLRKTSSKNNVSIWRRVAEILSKSSRQRPRVNVGKLNRVTKTGQTIIVPGKVVGSGNLNHKLTISAWAFSHTASEKVKQAGGKCLTLEQLIKRNPKGSNILLIG